VPTIAFGVPGSVSMAILLGAFIIQGLTPGPELLDPAKRLPLTFSFVWLIVLANVVTVAACFLFLNQLAKITYIKGTYLIPFILLLVYLGGFTVKNSFGDMILVMIFGGLGWLMVQLDWPRPPMLLGIVLGGIAEANLFIATRIYGASWLLRPGVIFISLLIAAAFAYAIREGLRNQKSGKAPAADVEMTVIVDRGRYGPLFALFFVAAFAYVLYEAFFGYGADFPRAALFPKIIGTFSVLLALAAFALTLPQALRVRTEHRSERPAAELITARRRTLAMIWWVLGFFAAIWLFGFVIAVPLATFVYLTAGARERWAPSLMLAAIAWVFFYGLFERFLHLPFPPGQIAEWLSLA
jgi:hypothetical protein